MRLLFLGPPGSGKSTLFKRLHLKYPNLQYISSGDIIRGRQTIKKGQSVETVTNENKKFMEQNNINDILSSYISMGKLIPDRIMNQFILSNLNNLNDQWVLDGFPRNLSQAKWLTEKLDSIKQSGIEHVIQLDVPLETIAERINCRYIHPASGRVYNLNYNPPKVQGKDDVTGEELVQRPDDNSIAWQRRVSEYNILLPDLQKYYFDKLTILKGNTTDELFKQLSYMF